MRMRIFQTSDSHSFRPPFLSSPVVYIRVLGNLLFAVIQGYTAVLTIGNVVTAVRDSKVVQSSPGWIWTLGGELIQPRSRRRDSKLAMNEHKM